jgi:RHS repeat-associated protein
MTNMVDGLGTTKYTYSPAGQLLSEDGPFASDIVTNGYSNRMRTSLGLQQPAGFWTNGFTYDSTRRLTDVTSPAGAFGYLYDPTLFTHHASRIALPNTSYITNVYDADARLTATSLIKSDNITVFDSYTYVYNPANQRTNLTRADSSTVAYKYDNIGQLKVADSSVNTEDRGYTYDSAWNLNYRTNNGVLTTFTVDNKNQLTNVSGLAQSQSYDSNGNLIVGYVAGRQSWIYSYDDENRLIQVVNTNTFSGGNSARKFVYDGLGRLRKRLDYTLPGWTLNFEMHYIYDGWRVIQERDINNRPDISYTRGNDLSGSMEGAGGIGGLLARSGGNNSGSWTNHHYYFADGNGNITCMLGQNSMQTIAATYRYDPFGNTISSVGALASDNVYRFSSKEIVTNGMYFYGSRFYDPNLQRWINRDPSMDLAGLDLPQSALRSPDKLDYEPNSYEFVINQPVNLVDTDGRDWWPPSKWPGRGKPKPKPTPKKPKPPTAKCPPGATPDCKQIIADFNRKSAACAIEGDPYDAAVSVCQCTCAGLPEEALATTRCAKTLTDQYRKACE